MRRLAPLLACVVLLVASRASSDEPCDTPLEHRRPPDQTYLTYPEWFLVHSPNEYAQFVAESSPGAFPFIGHLGQLWSSYGAMIEATSEHELNFGYHMMILVIATSTSGEYGIRSVYENLIGRLTEATQLGERTPEEALGADVAQEYVDFINERPWYEFDFIEPLERLWIDTPFFGPDMVRKVERRYVLTSEYLAKAGYAWLIGLGTAASYEPAAPVTGIVLERMPDHVPDDVELDVLEQLPDGATIATLPRYEPFGRQMQAIAREGAELREVAGNRGPILVSVIVPRGGSARVPGHVMLVQPILTRPEEERVIFDVPVAELADALRRIGPEELEHVYDF